MSPDRKWEVNIEYPLAVSVTSSLTDKVLRDPAPQTVPYTPGPIPRFTYLEKWFPDSTGFILYDEDVGCEKCPFDRLIIYLLDTDQGKLQHYVLEPLLERNTAFNTDVSFSPDGSQFAVTVNDREIYIVNRKAEVIQKISLDIVKEDFFMNVDWTRYGLLYGIETPHIGDGSDPYDLFLRKIDMTDPTRSDTLLLKTTGYGLGVLSVDPFSPRLVLYDSLAASPPNIWSELIIFNMQSQQLEDVLCTNSNEVPSCDLVNASGQHIFAMKMGDQTENLYIFDWATRKLTNKKYHIEKILEWRQDLQSFIVQQGNFPDEWLESIQP